MTGSDELYPKPGIRDWALLAIGIVFVLSGVIILPSNRDVGIVSLAMFGPATVVATTIILRKLRFRRQQPFGPYIADLFCPAAKLVIELDGDQHGAKDALAYDDARTHFLRERGYRVLRFSNDDVLRDPDRVAEVILAAVGPLPEIRSADFDPPSRGG